MIGLVLAMLAAEPAPQEDLTWSADSFAAAAAIKARKLELQSRPEERGCIGADAVTCLASMGFYVYLSSVPAGYGGYGELKLPKPAEHDINGRPISQVVSFLVTFAPGVTSIHEPEAVHADLFLADGVHVSRVTFSLPESPISAKTEAQWAATRVFEFATATVGDKCVGPDRLAFYRRYDDAQRVDGASHGYGTSYSDPSVSSGVHGHEMICGTRVEMTTASGISAQTGVFSGSTLSFSR